MLLKISPSTLDQWRVCREGLFNKTGADFIAYLEQPFESNNKIKLGSAFHKMAEKHKTLDRFTETVFNDRGQATPKAFVMGDDVLFEFNGSAIELARALGNLGGINEVRLSKTYTLCNSYKVYSEMVVDLANGLHLHEFKTKSVDKQPTEYDLEQSEEYYSGCLQWRMYLNAMPEAQSITYWVCYLRTDPDNDTVITGAYKPLTFRFQPYPEMARDIEQEMEGLVKFLELNGKLHLIEKKH